MLLKMKSINNISKKLSSSKNVPQKKFQSFQLFKLTLIFTISIYIYIYIYIHKRLKIAFFKLHFIIIF